VIINPSFFSAPFHYQKEKKTTQLGTTLSSTKDFGIAVVNK
jgi:hypothetical protein